MFFCIEFWNRKLLEISKIVHPGTAAALNNAKRIFTYFFQIYNVLSDEVDVCKVSLVRHTRDAIMSQVKETHLWRKFNE